jgi:hypothetical protein
MTGSQKKEKTLLLFFLSEVLTMAFGVVGAASVVIVAAIIIFLLLVNDIGVGAGGVVAIMIIFHLHGEMFITLIVRPQSDGTLTRPSRKVFAVIYGIIRYGAILMVPNGCPLFPRVGVWHESYRPVRPRTQVIRAVQHR